MLGFDSQIMLSNNDPILELIINHDGHKILHFGDKFISLDKMRDKSYSTRIITMIYIPKF